MEFGSSTVEPIDQDLSEIIDVDGELESDKWLQRVGWVNEGIKVLKRRAVPEESARGFEADRVGVSRHLPRGIDGTASTIRYPTRAPRSTIVVPSHRNA